MVAKLIPSLSALLVLFVTLMTVALYFLLRIAHELGCKDTLLISLPILIFVATGLRFFYFLDWFIQVLLD